MPSLSHFTPSRQPHWAELERLLARSEGNGLRSFDADQIEAFARAYRQTVCDLAIAQRDFPDDQLTLWLNGLAARAHLRLYRAPAPSWQRLGQFFWTDFARRFRAARCYLLISALLLFGPALLAYLAALLDPTLRDALVPARLRQVMESGTTWTDMQPEVRPGMATLIFTNNIQVSFLAFAGGVLCGLGTVYVLVSNGLSLGAVLGAAQFYGVAPLVWSFISPHGYLELTCIVIAGAAGLLLGNALLRPGLQLRREALARAARRAVELVVGTAPVLVVAGLIEGFISPSDLPIGIKLAIGPLAGVGLYTLLLTVGRQPTGVTGGRAV
ncbi:MAG TPA: stage II sporulation protein M [Chloroflexota bacterium]|nr:stage II sporulation protein M [Chloroflexota bacterium]